MSKLAFLDRLVISLLLLAVLGEIDETAITLGRMGLIALWLTAPVAVDILVVTRKDKVKK